MITIELYFDHSGLLKRCRADGHAGAGSKGNDIVCAAVSILLRATYRTLLKKTGIKLRERVPERGAFFLELENEATEEASAFLFAVGSFLKEGLQSVSEEYPQFCTVKIYTEE
ncbi:MAG: ribosomal-processing cysteine protease Prp [Spirochaetaceae bacterium]|jgi:uncharacterized protein YsxB (DUF464 family)|nr:ribosomal-processing cysteine protease Prp [Spirochaetaceae bacterium]